MKSKHPPRFTSVAVQTSPPLGAGAAHSTHRSSPAAPAPTRTKLYPRGGVANVIEDLQAHVDLLSGAINEFKKERQSIKDTIEASRKPTNSNLSPPSTNPPAPVYVGVPPVPRSPPQHQLTSGPPPPQPPPNKSQPNFQHILRVEHECIRCVHPFSSPPRSHPSSKVDAHKRTS